MLTPFKTSTTPKYFTVSSSVGTIGKENFITALTGRQGIISKNGNDFYYTISDITVNENKVEFIEASEELVITNLEELNNYLISEPFELNDNSSFNFSLRYGAVKNDEDVESLGENDLITYRVELIDAVTEEILGTYSEASFSEGNIPNSSITYNVNTDGIGNKNVKLRIRAIDNSDASYEIATLYSTEEIIAKSSVEQIGYQGELTITDYELAQNYPNPFNPTTQIKFAIPQDGIVSLKIYDVLGKEVKTLLDEYRNKGSYEVQFNASDLASGVYLYQIKVNDFAATKKMMLLK